MWCNQFSVIDKRLRKKKDVLLIQSDWQKRHFATRKFELLAGKQKTDRQLEIFTYFLRCKAKEE